MIPIVDTQVRYLTRATNEMIKAMIENVRPTKKVARGTKAESHGTSMIRAIANTQTLIGPKSESNDTISAVADMASFFATDR